ncbi:hypothetical protein D3C79_451160 [compost metagenome]
MGSAGRLTYQNGIHASDADLLIKTSKVVSAVAKRRICWNGPLTESCVTRTISNLNRNLQGFYHD